MVSQGDKKQIAVRIPLRLKAALEREARERGTSRSEYIRSILGSRHEAGRLRERVANREARIDQLEEQLAKRSSVEEKVDVLQRRLEDRDEPEPPFVVRWWRWWRSRGDDS